MTEPTNRGDPMTEPTPETLAELRRMLDCGGTTHSWFALARATLAALPALLNAAAERDRLRTWQERVALAAGIAEDVDGYGVHLEADPDVAAEYVAGLLSAAVDHDKCPIYCGECGEPLADELCSHCGGSGCGPGTAMGAYEECGWCAGAGKVHPGCANATYAELTAERDALAAKVAAVRALHSDSGDEETTQGYLIDGAGWRYGYMAHFCKGEAASDEYGTPWPCPTIRALDGTEADHA